MPSRTTFDRTQVPEDVLAISRRLVENGHGAWVVGGCVRDHLIERDVADWDLCTSATPREVARIFAHSLRIGEGEGSETREVKPHVVPTGIEHGTVTVVLRGKHYEVTTLRGESTYSDGRRPDAVTFVKDVTSDLARRDFTVNAIAWDPMRDMLIDPFEGMKDLDRRVIRAVGDPMGRFGEDGLRVLRAARFVATLGFEMDPATHAAIAPNLDTFRKVSAERVRDEWMKTMKAPAPSRAFEVMRETGILGVVCAPLLEGVGCAQNRWHAFDVWTHTMVTLDGVAPGDPVLRIAALLHDIAKPRTRAQNPETGESTFLNHERLGAEMAEDFMRAFRFSNDERARVTHLIRHHLVAYDDAWTDAAVRRFVQRVGAGHLESLFALCRADSGAKGRPDADDNARLDTLRARVSGILASSAALSPKDLAINGNDLQKILGLPPSKKLGEILAALLERVIDDPSLNTRDGLLELARAMTRDGAAN